MALKIPRHFLKLVRYKSISSCGDKPEESKSLWRYFKEKKVVDDQSKKKPSAEACRKKRGGRQPPDPDLSSLGGQPYKTCGSAYVIQKETTPSSDEPHMSEEERILKKIESDPSLKNSIEDPMPPYRSVEQRLLDLNERKLHPFYKVYMSMPKRHVADDKQQFPEQPYESRSGPINPDEVPERLKLNKELLERKNIFADFKRVQLPRQMVARLVEMEKNRKPTLEKKKKNDR